MVDLLGVGNLQTTILGEMITEDIVVTQEEIQEGTTRTMMGIITLTEAIILTIGIPVTTIFLPVILEEEEEAAWAEEEEMGLAEEVTR